MYVNQTNFNMRLSAQLGGTKYGPDKNQGAWLTQAPLLHMLHDKTYTCSLLNISLTLTDILHP